MQSNKFSLLRVNNTIQYSFIASTMDKYRAEEPRYLWYCGTKKYRKSDGTGTVEKWYRGAAVVPWYRATLLPTLLALCY